MEYRRSWVCELKKDRRTDDLGVCHGKRARQGGRCCGAQCRHGQETDWDTSLRKNQRAIDALWVLT